MSNCTPCIRGRPSHNFPGQACRAHAASLGPCLSAHNRLRHGPFGQKVPATHRRQTQVAVFLNVPFPEISPDVLIPPFQISNVAISVLWAPIIIAPKWKVTEAIAKSRWSIIVPSIAFLYFFLAGTIIDSPDLADVFQKSIFLFTDGAADPKNMAKLLSSPAYADQDWVHVLIWDYGAGRLIYLDALKKGVPIRPSHDSSAIFLGLTSASVFHSHCTENMKRADEPCAVAINFTPADARMCSPVGTELAMGRLFI